MTQSTRPLRGYEMSIAKATGYTDPDVVAIIEDTMRGERPTLDALSRAAFDRLARRSAEVAIVLGAVAIADYAVGLAS